MNKKVKKVLGDILFLLLAIYSVFCLVLVAGLGFIIVKNIYISSRIETIETKYYEVELHHLKKYATVTDLTVLGKEQPVLIIPPFIEGYPVKYIGDISAFMVLGERAHALNLDIIQEKIYLPYTLHNRVGISGSHILEIILNQNEPSEELIQSIGRFHEGKLYYLAENTKINTHFMWNFEGAENGGYYFVDYINGTNKYSLPPDPVREGYSFFGWYYEEKGTNFWDGTMPTSQEESITLYAKWI